MKHDAKLITGRRWSIVPACSCGWTGRETNDEGEAKRAAYAHAQRANEESPPDAQNRLVPLLGQQIELDGQLHDLSPQTRQESLFGYDAQLAGQTYMDTTNESETDHAD